MIFYELLTVRLIKYFDLADVLLPPVDTKPSEVIKLKVNEQYVKIISALMTVTCFISCLTIPFAVLEKPLLIFSRDELFYLHQITKYIQGNLKTIDRFIIALYLLLVYVSVITILDAIKNTNIKISPWVLKGKYFPRGYKPPIDPAEARRALKKTPADPYGALEFRMNRVKVKTPKYEKREPDQASNKY